MPTVTHALVQAAHALAPWPSGGAAPSRGATLSELAERAQVAHQTARHLVPKLKSRGQLTIVGTRRVSYRNRPVAEYAPASPLANPLNAPGASGATAQPDIEHLAGDGWVDLGRIIGHWAR